MTKGEAMTVVNLDEYRDFGQNAGLPCQITFFWPSFINLEGKQTSFKFTVDVPDGDVKGVITRIANDGSIWARSEETEGDYWFAPWPSCVAARLRLPEADSSQP
jgi:hypothetical protein